MVSPNGSHNSRLIPPKNLPFLFFSKEGLSPAENSPLKKGRFVASCAPSAIAGVVRWETPDHFLLLFFSSLLESKYSGMIERCPESPFFAISGMGLFCNEQNIERQLRILRLSFYHAVRNGNQCRFGLPARIWLCETQAQERDWLD